MHYSHYALPSLVSAVVMLILFLFVFFFRRKATGGWQFLGLMLTCTIWAFGYTMSVMTVDEGLKLFWYNLSQIGPDFAPVFWVFLVLEHIGKKHLFKGKWIYSLFALPLITTILMWTNDWHHLLREAVHFNIMNDASVYISTQRGPWFYVEIAYAYILVCISFGLLFYFLKWSAFKTQTWVLILGFIPPIVSNILDIFNANPLHPYGSASFHFSVTGIIFAWGLFYEKLLNITPIARNKVLENIGDGVIVLDKEERIIDINPVGEKILSHEGCKKKLIGEGIHNFIPKWPVSDLGADEDYSIELDFECPSENQNRIFSLKLSRLTDKSDSMMGWVAILHDITREIETNHRLTEQLEEIKQLQDELRDMAIRDPLTDCYNRRYLEQTFSRETSRADRDKVEIGLVMLDIDDFKQVNDNFGHLLGDQVLKFVGKTIMESVRLGDIVYRYGGEEFLVILPGISRNAALKCAQRFCQNISACDLVPENDQGIRVTASAGVAMYPLHSKDIYEVLSHADEALYAAKNAGKNRVSIWET